MFETGRYGAEGSNAWSKDWNCLPYYGAPAICRGGAYNDGDVAGVCAISAESGEGRDWTTFRACIVVEQ